MRGHLSTLGCQAEREMEIVEELAQHLEDVYEEALTNGASTDEAFRRAAQEIVDWRLLECELGRGTAPRTQQIQAAGSPIRRDKKGTREARMERLVQDLRYALRMLAKNPGFTAVAIVALALGIGANTAVFSVVNAVLLKPLPYLNPAELVLLYSTDSRGEDKNPLAPAAYLHLKNQSTVFAGVAALSNKELAANLTGADEPERLRGYQISADLFPMLGATPAFGRGFLPEEDRPGGDQVVLLSHGLWQRRFGADRGIVGRVLTLNGSGYTVVGVMPPDFQFYRKADLWAPLAFTGSEESNRNDQYLYVMARLKPGVSLEQARAEVDAASRNFPAAPDRDFRAGVMLPHEYLIQEARPALLVLLGAVGLVLLIACANVANLLLARASARHKEFAIRTALGANRRRVIRQLLTEGFVLALAGGAGGLLIATWVTGFLVNGLPDDLVNANARVAMVGVDAQALCFTLAVALVASVLFSLAPAVHASRFDLHESLKEGGRTDSAGRRRARLRALFVVSEVALSLVLLVSAGLMIKSFWRLSKTNPGFDPAGVLSVQIDLPEAKYGEPAQIRDFYQRAIERVAAIPGVSRAGVINNMQVTTGFTVEGSPPADPGRRPQTHSNQVSPDYFRAKGVPLLAGRFFTSFDSESAKPVVIINEALARNHFPEGSPVGKHLRIWDESREIVGVVGTDKINSMTEEPQPRTYLPYSQQIWSGMSLIVRAATDDPASLAPAIRREVASVDPYQPIYDVQTLEQSVTEWVAPVRFITLLLGGFAALAALLAAVGVYGVMAYLVAQRTHEIGIRLALGASRGDILREVVGQGMGLAAVGIALGLAGALALTRLLSALLYGVGATDPVIFLVVPLLLAGVVLLASLLPARRATQVDPLVALRHE